MFLTLVIGAHPSSSDRIDTVAGTLKIAVDGIRATEAQLEPIDVAVDGEGNVFIADRWNNLIRRVDAAGIITTVAGGGGYYGFSGDGGPGIEAELSSPAGVAVDRAGNLFIADADQIRKVDAAGIITTIAGTGEFGFSGDGGPAIQAQFRSINNLAVDSAGNVFIADSGNGRIRKVDATGIITTIAGTGEFGFSGDGGPAIQAQFRYINDLAVDSAGNVFIADSRNGRIRKVDAAGIITTVAGSSEYYGFSGDGGPAIEAELSSPAGVAVDRAGNLFIADTGNDRIRKVDAAGTITTVAGNGEPGFSDGGPAIHVRLFHPQRVAVDSAGSLFISELVPNICIRKVDAAGIITTIAGTGEHILSGDDGPATQAEIGIPSGLAVDGAGNLFIADSINDRIRKVDVAGIITTVAGTREWDIKNRSGDLECGFSGDGGPATEAQLCGPSGVALDTAGNLFFIDKGNDRIRKVDTAGMITTVAGIGVTGRYTGDGGPAINAGLRATGGILTTDRAGNLFFIAAHYRIRKVDAAGIITTIAGTGESGYSGDGGPATQAKIRPSGLAVDTAGNLFIAETLNNRIRKVDTAGIITTIAGTGEYGFSGDGGPAIQAKIRPSGLGVDTAGNLFFGNEDNRIRQVNAAGIITTIAGTGEYGFSGDGGLAIQANIGIYGGCLGIDCGLVVDSTGNLFFAQGSWTHVLIRRLTPALDLAHFANGQSIRSDVVLVNVLESTIYPTIYFYDSTGAAMDADSLLDLSGGLTATADNGVRVAAGIDPMGQRTIETLGEGTLMTGSVTVLSSGRGGGFLRFDLPGIGVAGVGASVPVSDAIFPVRRKKSGINTGAAIRNLGTRSLMVTCRLMQAGNVLEEAEIRLGAKGQVARFIDELFPGTETADFVGSVRCTGTEGGLFTGGALEMDAGNRIFTTLPVVPVAMAEAEDHEVTLDFAHFGNGSSTDGVLITSDLVLVNAGSNPVRPTVYFYDSTGADLDVDSLVDVSGNLEVQDNGGLSVRTDLPAMGEITISTHGRGDPVTGSVKVVAPGPLGGVLRFNLPGVGVAGVGASQPVQGAIFPARQTGGIRTGIALHNLVEKASQMTCRLVHAGQVLEEVEIVLTANGQMARFIDELFLEAETSNFVGSVHCTGTEGGYFTGVALEMDAANRVFTTLPVVPVQ